MVASPLRAAFFLSDLDPGGAQRSIINVVNALPRTRIIPSLIVGRSNGAARDWLDPSHPLVDLGCARLRSALLRLRRLIARETPDVLVTTMIDANIVASLAARLTRRPPRLILRETNSHRARGDLSYMRRSAVSWAYASADSIVALSNGVAAELVQDYALDPTRVVTIYNPVDTATWRCRAAAARKSVPPWDSFGGGDPILISAGRLIEQKGFDLLLQALAACRGEGKRARLIILGEGRLRGQLTALADELGLSHRLLMPGHVADPALWYAHGQVFLLPSRWEGFGHVLVEAMACGLPTIAFDCPYGPAEILGNREGGVLVAPNHVIGLAQAIDQLLGSSGQRQMLAEAGERCAERFSSQKIASQYAALIERVSHG